MQIQDQFDPRSWDDYFGHAHIVEQAKRLLHNNDIPRSCLVSGPTGVGKGSFVRLFIRALRCLERQPGQYNACGKCAQCRLDPRRAEPDLHDILWVQSGASSETLNSQIKRAIEFIQTPPVRRDADHRNYKILVIDEIDVIPYPQIVSLYYETELPQSHHARTICFAITMNELKIHDQQFRALGDRGIRFPLSRLSPVLISTYLRDRFRALSQHSADLLSEEANGSVRSALELAGRVRLIDPYMGDETVNLILQGAPLSVRRLLWQQLQNPMGSYKEFTELAQRAEGQCDRRMLIRQLQKDVEASIETMPSAMQLQFLTTLLNVRHQDLPLSHILGLFKGKSLVDLRLLQEQNPSPLSFLFSDHE